MSNGSFDGLCGKLLGKLQERGAPAGKLNGMKFDRPKPGSGIVLFAAVLFFARPAHATIDYTVSVAHPERHISDVTMHVPNVRDQLTLQMPAWNALYQIRDFSSHMMQVSARDDEESRASIGEARQTDLASDRQRHGHRELSDLLG